MLRAMSPVEVEVGEAHEASGFCMYKFLCEGTD